MKSAFRAAGLLAAAAFLAADVDAASPTAAPRAVVLERMAELLEARYLDEARGRELASMLRAAEHSARFATLEDPRTFARAAAEDEGATAPR